MKVIIWNMGHWQCPVDRREDAWDLLESHRPAFALLQECVPPQRENLHAVYRPIGGQRNWGSAVVSWVGPLREITSVRGRYNKSVADLSATWPGSVAVAEAELGSLSLTLVSMYGLIDNGYADTTVNRQLSDLVPLFDNAHHDSQIMLGGDLNITTQWNDDQARYARWERATLDRIRAFGLIDCVDRWRTDGRLEGCGCGDGEACRHVRTQHHGRSEKPWQNDYVFASEPLLEGGDVIDAGVLDDPEWRRFSEHLPVYVELNT